MCINGIILLYSRMTQHSKSTILQQKIFIVLKKYSKVTKKFEFRILVTFSYADINHLSQNW